MDQLVVIQRVEERHSDPVHGPTLGVRGSDLLEVFSDSHPGWLPVKLSGSCRS